MYYPYVLSYAAALHSHTLTYISGRLLQSTFATIFTKTINRRYSIDYVRSINTILTPDKKIHR